MINMKKMNFEGAYLRDRWMDSAIIWCSTLKMVDSPSGIIELWIQYVKYSWCEQWNCILCVVLALCAWQGCCDCTPWKKKQQHSYSKMMYCDTLFSSELWLTPFTLFSSASYESVNKMWLDLPAKRGLIAFPISWV